MAGNNDLKILISASLNFGKSLSDINAAIFGLEKKVKSLKIKIDIDSKILETFSNFNKNLNQIIQSAQLQNNTFKDTTKIINQETQAIKDATDAQKKWNAEKRAATSIGGNVTSVTTTYGNNQNNSKQVVTSTPDGSIKKIVDIENQKKDLADYNKMLNQAYRMNADFNKKAEALDRAHYEALRTNAAKTEAFDKMHYLALQQNRQLDIKAQEKHNRDAASLLAAQNKAELQVLNLNRRYGSNVDQTTLNNYLSQIKALTPATENFRAEAARLTNEINKIGASAKVSSGHTLALGEALKSSLVKMTAFIVGGSVITAPFQFIREGITYVNELNKSLTELSIVYMKSQSAVAKYGEQFHNMGMEMGIATQELAKGAVEFARQGLSPEETTKRMAAAVQYAKISNIDFSTSAKILTATVNSMGVDINRAADVFSYMGDATATGADEIGRAFQKVGGTAGALNVSFEKTSSWIATISSRTRESAETIGQSVKSILARVQSLKETGFDEEDGTQVNQVAKALAEVDIQLMDSQGNFRNFGTVMDELGSRWDSLSNRQKAYLATTVAGTYQQSRFLNLMEGYKDSVSLYEKSLNSAGIAQQKFNLYQEGTEAKLTKLKNAFTGIFQSSFESGGIRSSIESLATLTVAIDGIVKKFGLLPPVIILGTTALLAFNTSMRTSIATFAGGKLLESLATAGLRIQALSVFTNAYTGSAIAARIATIGLQVALTGGIAIAITAITYGITKLIEKHQQLAAEQKAFEDEQKTISENWSTQKDKITSLIAEYNALNGVKSRTEEQEQKYLDVTSQLSKLMPNLVASIDAKGNAHLKSADAIAKELEYAQKLSNIENAKKLVDAKDTFGDTLKERAKLEKELSETQDKIKYKNRLGYNSIHYRDQLSESDVKALELKALGLGQQINEMTEKLKTDVTSLTGTIVKMSGVKFGDDVSVELEKIIGKLDVSKIDKDGFVKLTNDIGNALKTIQSVQNSKTSSSDGLIAYSNALEVLKTELNLSDVELTQFLDKINGVKPVMSNASNSTTSYKDSLSKLETKIEDTDKSISSLASAYQKLQEGEQLSTAEILKLAKEHPQLLTYLKEHNGLIEDKGAILQWVAEQENKAALSEAENLRTSVTNTFNALESKRKMYEEFYSKMAPMINPLLGIKGFTSKDYGNGDLTDAEKQQLADLKKQKEELDLTVQLLSKPINLATFNKKPKKPESEGSSYTDPIREETALTREFIDTMKSQYEAIEKNNQSIERKIKLAEKEKDHAKAIELTTELIRGQKDAIDQLEKAKSSVSGEASDLRSDNKFASLGDKFSADGVRFDAWFTELGDASEEYKKYVLGIEDADRALVEGKKKLTAAEKLQHDSYGDQLKDAKEIFSSLQQLKKAYVNYGDEQVKVQDAIDAATESIKNHKEEIDNLAVSNAMEKAESALKSYSREIKSLNAAINSTQLTNLEKITAESKLLQIYADERKQIDSNITSLENLSKTLDVNSEAYKENKKNLEDQIDLREQNISAIEAENAKLRNQLIEQLRTGYETQKNLQEKQLQDSYDAQVAAINEKTKALEDQKSAIDDLIKSLQDQWKAEDDNLKLAELQADVDKTKADKRFEIINADGTTSLTYDVQKATDLEKQLADEKTRISRDAQIKQLENQKAGLDSQIQIYRNAEEALQTSFNNQKQALDNYWAYKLSQTALQQEADNMIAKEGYKNALIDADQFVIDMSARWDTLVSNAVRAGAAIAAALGGTSGTSYSSSTLNSAYQNGGLESLAQAARQAGNSLETHHEGGVVGGQNIPPSPFMSWLRDKFNLKPNETLTKLLNGEIVMNPMKWVSSFTPSATPLLNGGNSSVNEQHYHFNNLTIKSDNVNGFLDQINFLVTSTRK